MSEFARRRSLHALLAAATLTVTGCHDATPSPPAPPATPAGTPGATTAPPVLEAVRAIYEGYAKAPGTFARGPHVSRFFAEQGQRDDDACRAGRACAGDRFVCLDPLPTSPGKVTDAVVTGEQPGVSASVKVKVEFAGRAAEPIADVVFEDGAWKIDQVRCP
jgi:hypothetical protein